MTLSFLEMANTYEISKVKFTTRKLNGDIDTTKRYWRWFIYYFWRLIFDEH
jgi:hypothetical protein